MDMRRLSVELPPHGTRDVRRMLLVWARVRRNPGYRQGMHELAAVLWRVCAGENADEPGAQAGPDTAPSAAEVDAFTLFSALMRRMDGWFSSDRTSSAALLKAAMHRIDPVLSDRLAQERVEWQPVVL